MLKTLFIGFVAVFIIILTPLALAQEAVPAESPGPTPSTVEYDLPYPGLLPDHPFYFLKILRDRFLTLFISNPIRKVEFYMLNADKRLNMGVFLFNKDKGELGMKTIHEARNYLEKADEKLFEIPADENLEISSLKDRFELSMMKHLEVVDGLRNREGVDKHDELDTYHENLRTFFDEFSRKK